jgi:polyisoprenoid-binding protein YceI
MSATSTTATATVELPTGTWTIDQAHSEVSFVVRHLMVSKVRGRFGSFRGTITVAPDPLDSTVEATIDVASVHTGDENRDNHLRSADFFDVETHPEMRFRSTAIRADGGDHVVVGDLTIHGVTRTVELALEFNGTSGDPWGGTRAGFSAGTELSRKEFGLEWNAPVETGGVVVGDKVKINLEIQAVKQ